MVRIGLIGAGSIADKYIQAIAELPNARITAVSATSLESAQRCADRCNAVPYVQNQELLNSSLVDAVIVCTPSGTHGEIAIAAAKAGKHVIVEKPLEISLKKMDEMITACHENQVQLHGIFNYRYKPVYRFLKKAVMQERFGKLINVNASVRWYRPPAYYQDSYWHGTQKLDGGGALMNQSIHYVDLLLWLAGEVTSVFGYSRKLFHSYMEAEDTAVAVMEYQSGAIGTLVATTSTVGGYPAELQLSGSRGSVVVQDDRIVHWSVADKDPMDAQVEAFQICKGNQSFTDPAAIGYEDHLHQLQEILFAIEDKGPIPITGEEARKAVALVLQIYRSSQLHQEQSGRSAY